MRTVIRRVLLAASAIPFAASFVAHAQTTPKQDAPAGAQLEEVVVTATKRAEDPVKVPVSVTVFTALDIEAAGIDRAADFLNSTPNVTFQEDHTGETFVNIRGQTSTRNSDPNVAIVIDGVVLTSVRGFNQDLFDVEQIEVVKGPQSALYGRNAAAGAIIINSKAPSDEFEGKATFGRGNFNATRVTGSVSGPITSTLKFRAAASFRDTDGPFSNANTAEKVMRTTPTLGRLRLLFEPSDKFTADLKVGFQKVHGGTLAYNAQVLGLPLGGFPGTAIDANNADLPFVSNITGVYDESYWDSALKLDYDLGFASLTSITGVNHLDAFFGGDLPPYVPDTGQPGALVAQYGFDDRNFSQELRLTSRSDQRLRWQVGVYYLHFKRNQYNELNVDSLGAVPGSRRVIDPPSAPQPTVTFGNPVYRTTSYAPFASLQFDITEQLHLNAAGRYDTEKRKVAEVTVDQINPLTNSSYNLCVQLTGRTVDQCSDKKTFHQFEPKISLSYDIADIGSTYVSYGKGFKSGGFNPIGAREAIIAAAAGVGLPASSVYVQNLYDKEVSTSYEIGAKFRLFDRRLSVNAAAFRTKVKGAQQFEFIPTVGLQTTTSIDKVDLKGFDVDFRAVLPAGLTLFGGYGYTDGTVKNFAGNPAFNGNVAPSSFKYTLNLGLTQTFALTDELNLTPRVDYNRYGSIWWDVANSPGTKRDPLDLVNARLTLSGGDRWEIAAYGDNLFNKKYFQEVVPILAVFTVNFRGMLRTYGVEATVKF